MNMIRAVDLGDFIAAQRTPRRTWDKDRGQARALVWFQRKLLAAFGADSYAAATTKVYAEIILFSERDALNFPLISASDMATTALILLTRKNTRIFECAFGSACFWALIHDTSPLAASHLFVELNRQPIADRDFISFSIQRVF